MTTTINQIIALVVVLMCGSGLLGFHIAAARNTVYGEPKVIEKEVIVKEDTPETLDRLHECNEWNTKLKKQQSCGKFNCTDVVYFMIGNEVRTGHITLFTNDVVKEGVIGAYWINEYITMVEPEHIGPERILPVDQVFGSKKQLLDSIK